jgi:uncharacterized protein (DUF2267 family)
MAAPIQVKVSTELIAEVKNLLNLSPEMPANYAVDTALRELKDRLEKEKASIGEN